MKCTEAEKRALLTPFESRREKIGVEDRCGKCQGLGFVVKKEFVGAMYEVLLCDYCGQSGIFDSRALPTMIGIIFPHVGEDTVLAKIHRDMKKMIRQRYIEKGALAFVLSRIDDLSDHDGRYKQLLFELRLVIEEWRSTGVSA